MRNRPAPNRRSEALRAKIARRLDQGLSKADIARLLNVEWRTVHRHALAIEAERAARRQLEAVA